MKKSHTKSSAKKLADKWMSIYVRLRDSDKKGIVKCITSRTKLPWREMQCGHFMSRTHLSTRWNEQNTSGQCAGCNVFRAGRQYEHGKAIDKKYGAGTAERLTRESKMVSKHSIADILTIADHYKTKAHEEASKRGITL